MTQHGISQGEQNILSKTYNVLAKDVTKVSGRNLWKLTPEKATEISSKVHMNYSAMPAIVDLMRKTPIIGAPFGSFAYGMSALTAQTAIYNPKFFNEMQFLLH